MNPADLVQDSPDMARVWSAPSQVRRMLEFLAALAQAEAEAGVIPHAAADGIASACLGWLPEGQALEAIYQEAGRTGTPIIPLLERLSQRLDGSGRSYLYWGATSQDVCDTALVLQAREGLDLFIDHLMAICEECATLAEAHRATLTVGRTLLQQAVPITFGLKAARWLALVVRQVRRLREEYARISYVQLGGAAGTLASLGEAGMPVTRRLAQALGLGVPDLPWHTERDRVATLGAALGVLAGAMGKIALDLVLLSQTEVGEVAEAASATGQGRSSAMPQKRNPVNAVVALAASRRALGVAPVLLGAMLQEHERAAGGWQAESGALPDLFCHAMGSVAHVEEALRELRVDTQRMRAHVSSSHGLIMAESLTLALATTVGRPEAARLVQEAAQRAQESGVDLAEAARSDQRITAILPMAALVQALDPTAYLGSTGIYIDQALAAYHQLQDSL
ncbi:MAG: 3-carboxy-cis,cis-muconate cycloisomerase [Chloroflexi bacterium]|nr:MAG: 3-carboxy-cis,cis-muconate cycloisomerase [Chloroflexota bacterium]